MFRMTIRATDDSVPPVLIKIMEERLSTGNLAELERPIRSEPQVVVDPLAYENVEVQ